MPTVTPDGADQIHDHLFVVRFLVGPMDNGIDWLFCLKELVPQFFSFCAIRIGFWVSILEQRPRRGKLHSYLKCGTTSFSHALSYFQLSSPWLMALSPYVTLKLSYQCHNYIYRYSRRQRPARVVSRSQTLYVLCFVSIATLASSAVLVHTLYMTYYAVR
ncbi:hypothetical protein BDY21DRAFT_132987 [Lineolata rhizophorae]|uniref:Uncharacterized protein n=1 Tax=Lineolata rhizophorae TaxID=578093 RepID=A0A6A6PA93_9PEZI|nr:hypothetical protein BDY21DRAFT_132987 [Lineolata rhizophorae]